MNEYRIPEMLCDYFNDAGLGIRFVPETWRENSASLWMTAGGSEKNYIDGSKMVSLPFEIRMRCDGRSIGDRMQVLDVFTEIAELIDMQPPEECAIAMASPPSKSAIYENGEEEYRASYVMRYKREKKEY